MALPNYPRNPDYGTGTYRRRIRLEQGDGCVYGALEDTNHGFTVTVYHDGEHVTAIEGDAKRVPYTSCPGALNPIKGYIGSGTGKTHIALGLGLAACQKGLSVGFTTAASLVNELLEARNEKRLLRTQKLLASYHLLIIDELGFVPLSKTGAELLFEVFSQRYERGSLLVTSNLPFDEWTEVLGSERLTGALLDRLTHQVHILTMNGDSYRLNQSKKRQRKPSANPANP
jgi:chromosomal replication initiation ATPase DnaA